MTEDKAQVWLQFRQIRHVWKPSDYADDPRWRCHLMRPTEMGLLVYVPNKSVTAVLRLIAVEGNV
jgi:hypothetical protein